VPLRQLLLRAPLHKPLHPQLLHLERGAKLRCRLARRRPVARRRPPSPRRSRRHRRQRRR
jgi:hypothetical protein